ncbi:sigma-70 family RNA polymerase sigma factor [Nocardioides sp.]|uniref:sigma-70 family RNA polymerase sigma factor n=1 Tax=Nocardioides sp. TaxID=35761 RepID=UPI003784845A
MGVTGGRQATVEIGFDEFAAVETTRLLGLARVLCGNDHDAWDLTQETLARVSARWDRLAHHDNLPAYARTTLANLHRNARRRRREVLVAEPLDRAAAAPADASALDAWLDAAMRSLPHRQRVAVALTYLEDRPIGEVADILGCGVATAKTHLARGRDSLRRAAEAARAAQSEDQGR